MGGKRERGAKYGREEKGGGGGSVEKIGKVGGEGVPFGRLCSLVVETRGAGGR